VLGRNDADRKLITSSIGPFWDGNEVWLIVAGAAMFAAFPQWYATMLSGFYLGVLVLLVALIVRGVAFEFRNRVTDRRWHKFWDSMIFIGSLVPSLFWGIAVANLIKGVPVDAKMQYKGSLLDLLSPYALLGGATFVALFVLHGALFLSLKSEGKIRERAERAARLAWLPAVGLAGGFGLASYIATDMFNRPAPVSIIAGIAAVVALLAGGVSLQRGRFGIAFLMSGLTVALATITIFSGLFPRVMVSSLNPDWSLTVTNASSSPYSLQITSWVSLTLIPVVIAYQAWNYWVFRQRVSHQTSHHL
jgi:cytochrome d ubiquinol oxidase subunit II